MNEPLSESSVSLKLAEIQKRCSELMDDPDDLQLCLDDGPALVAPENDPYNSKA